MERRRTRGWVEREGLRSASGAVVAGLLVMVSLLTSGISVARAQEGASGVDAITTRARDHAPADDYESGRLAGMGYGARAGAASTSAVVANAANIPLMRVYHVESMAQYMPGQNAWSVGGVFADSMTNKLSAGLMTRGVFGNGDRDYKGFDSRLALGASLSDRFGVGFSVRYLNLHSRSSTLDGQPLSDNAKGFTVDASLRATLATGLNVAALGYNLVPTHSTLAPLMFGGSVAYAFQNKFDLGVDAFADFTSFERTRLLFGVGAGYFAGGAVPMRAGYRYDQGRQLHTLTGSIGYVAAKYALELAFHKSLNTSDSTLVLTFRVHVE